MAEGEGGPVAVRLTGPMGYKYKPSLNPDMTGVQEPGSVVAPGWRRERGGPVRLTGPMGYKPSLNPDMTGVQEPACPRREEGEGGLWLCG